MITLPSFCYNYKRGIGNIFSVGQGYDAHRLEKSRPLILGGIEIQYEKGLLGHSDADVLIHAIIDALLGAAGLMDIGYHFPDGDAKWKGASSIEMLKTVNRMILEQGWTICNIDCTIVAQSPKLAAYMPRMKESITSALGIEIEKINIKAKTTEGMGFVGEGLGMEAYAVTLLNSTR